MIAVLVWKEYREHRWVWLSLAVVAAVSVAALGRLYEALMTARALARQTELGWSAGETVQAAAAFVVVAVYGALCGAMLLAGERESGTLAFLNWLRVRRSDLWWVKYLVGLVLTGCQAVVITVVALAAGLRKPPAEQWSAWIFPLLLWVGIVLVGWQGLAWGMFFSARARTVLSAVAATAAILLLIFLVSDSLATFSEEMAVSGVLFSLVVAVIALRGSWRDFCRRDLSRGSASGVRMPPPGRDGGTGGFTPRRWDSKLIQKWRVTFPAWRSLAWLACRQGRWQVAGMAAVGAGVGLFLPRYGVALWPIYGLVLGVLCGMAVLGRDKAGEANRFLAHRRLPVGGVWAIKTAVWLGVAAAVGGVVVLVAAARLGLEGTEPTSYAYPRNLRGRLEGLVAWVMGTDQRLLILDPLAFWLVWPAYGFAFGQLLSLVVRKNVVALVLALGLGAAAAGVWMPSLLLAGMLGGVPLWQILGIPFLLLVASRLIVWAWAAGEMGHGGSIACVVLCGVLAVAWLAGGLWYRTAEFPDIGPPFDVAAYLASLPRGEANRGGELVREALVALAKHEEKVSKAVASMSEAAGPQQGMRPPVAGSYTARVQEAAQRGWPAHDREVGRWLDEVFGGTWVGQLREAATLPPGMIDDPRTPFANRPARGLDLVYLFPARALQLQARGDNVQALDVFEWDFTISRNLCTHANTSSYRDGRGMARVAADSMTLWLREVGPRPALLERALNELTRLEGQTPPYADCRKPDYIQFRERALSPPGVPGSSEVGTLLAAAWETPWERERRRRMLNYMFAPDEQVPLDRKLEVDNRLRYAWVYPHVYARDDAPSLAAVRAVRTVIALALYRVREHRPARGLNDLVPRYLSDIPIDPSSGEPLFYQVANGEGRVATRERLYVVPTWPERMGH